MSAVRYLLQEVAEKKMFELDELMDDLQESFIIQLGNDSVSESKQSILSYRRSKKLVVADNSEKVRLN